LLWAAFVYLCGAGLALGKRGILRNMGFREDPNAEGLYPEFSRKELKIVSREIDKESRRYGNDFVELDTTHNKARGPLKAWRNRSFLVQLYLSSSKWLRLSIGRTVLDVETRRWKGNSSWDELMEIKERVGYGDCEFIEIYPKSGDVVNEANIRHLWLLPEGHNIDCIWRSSEGKD
jgi:hypothetical protein